MGKRPPISLFSNNSTQLWRDNTGDGSYQFPVLVVVLKRVHDHHTNIDLPSDYSLSLRFLPGTDFRGCSSSVLLFGVFVCLVVRLLWLLILVVVLLLIVCYCVFVIFKVVVCLYGCF